MITCIVITYIAAKRRTDGRRAIEYDNLSSEESIGLSTLDKGDGMRRRNGRTKPVKGTNSLLLLEKRL